MRLRMATRVRRPRCLCREIGGKIQEEGLAQDEARLVSASEILGDGFPDVSLEAGMACRPRPIGVDSASSDPGPRRHGPGKLVANPLAIRRDLVLFARTAARVGVGAGGPRLKKHGKIQNFIVDSVAVACICRVPGSAALTCASFDRFRQAAIRRSH